MGQKLWLKLISLLFLASIVASDNWRTSTSDNKMVISDAVLRDDTDLASLDFSNIEDVELDSADIETFTIQLQSTMRNVRKIYVRSGNVPKVQVAAHFERIYIDRSNTHTVEIDPTKNYKAVDFAVTNNKLKSLPKNLSAMRNLQELNFYSNLIETVDMAEFNGLDSLQEITLSKNQIAKISFSQAILPSLKYFDLTFNRINSIRMDSLTAPLFEAINLMGNQLETVDLSQFSNFPLQVLYLDYNKIKQITPNSVALSKLEVFSIASNQLNDISFQNWTTPSLQVINVEENQLKKIPGLAAAAFPALKQVGLFPNPFDCDWLDATVKDLENNSVKVASKYKSNCGEEGSSEAVTMDAP